MLLPISFAIYSTHSPVVVLGQTYLAKNIGFASGITLGLSFSVGGVVVPFMGSYADDKGLPAVMGVLLIVALLGALATFLLPQESKRIKNLE